MRIGFIILLLLSPLFCFAQTKYILSGYVQDEASGEALIGANIYCFNSQQGVTTNEFGFFSFTLPADSVVLRISYVGYQNIVQTIFFSQTVVKKNFYLKQGVDLKGITISDFKDINKNEMSTLRLKPSDIERLPSVLGEKDVMQVLKLLPGIETGGESKGGLNVRGGSSDQNLVLLDDVPLYHVGHFGNIFSIFNTNSISDVTMMKGAFPARYGGRLSSVLDIRTKDGNLSKYQFQAGIGLLLADFSAEGPIIKDKTSFLFTARTSTLPAVIEIGALKTHFYDINAKVGHRFSDNDKLFFSFYTGDDRIWMNNKSKEKEVTNTNYTLWGNTLGSLRWNHIFNSKLFSNTTFYGVRYRYEEDYQYQNKKNDAQNEIAENYFFSGINDFGLKIDLAYYLSSKLKFNFGASSVYHHFTPVSTKSVKESLIRIEMNYKSEEFAWENTLYAEADWKPLTWIGTNIGLRFVNYDMTDYSYNMPEPRLLLSINPFENFSIKAAYSYTMQYLHLLSSFSNTGSPSDFWMPATENLHPETSNQLVVGLFQNFDEQKFTFSVEGYYKNMSNLISFLYGESFSGDMEDWEAKVEKNGTGISQGIEFLLKKNTGKLTGWIAYTLAKTDVQFENLNSGSPFPSKYDRRHNFSIVAMYEINKRWDVSATWQYGTGYPVTLPTARYIIDGNEFFHTESINSYRMDAYHRLDVGANCTLFGKKTTTIISLSILNVYNHLNPYFYYFDRMDNDINPDLPPWEQTLTRVSLRQQSFYPFLPSLSVRVKF